MEPPDHFKGRGTSSNTQSRFVSYHREALDDGWGHLDKPPPPLTTTLETDTSRSVITYNSSPDVGFDRSINPYRGCEQGCVYCFARPTHAYLNLSPGLDFESRLFYKPDAATQLRKELSHPRYRCSPLAVGINTDGYQPVERRLQLTRSIIEILLEFRHPFTLVTKSALIQRDIDVLEQAAARRLVHVVISLTTLDRTLCRRLEPRAASPQKRLEVIGSLSTSGIPVSVLMAPVIPVLTEYELETLMGEARKMGAIEAGYVLLRLPYEVKGLFREWLRRHEPEKADHVMNRIKDYRGGKDNDPRFGTRMTGTGPFSDLLRSRFSLAYRRLNFPGLPDLDCSSFRSPTASAQASLYESTESKTARACGSFKGMDLHHVGGSISMDWKSEEDHDRITRLGPTSGSHPIL